MITIERIYHFSCQYCKKWWTIGDAEPNRRYFCPWCGKPQAMEYNNFVMAGFK